MDLSLESVLLIEQSITTAAVEPKKTAPSAPAEERPSPLYAAMLTSDVLLNTRKSVDDILRESKMAAVEEWHRSKEEEKEMSLDEKVRYSWVDGNADTTQH